MGTVSGPRIPLVERCIDFATLNLVFKYYLRANICYVYMADVPNAQAGWSEDFDRSEWL